jgi:hypothetical protein
MVLLDSDEADIPRATVACIPRITLFALRRFEAKVVSELCLFSKIAFFMHFREQRKIVLFPLIPIPVIRSHLVEHP